MIAPRVRPGKQADRAEQQNGKDQGSVGLVAGQMVLRAALLGHHQRLDALAEGVEGRGGDGWYQQHRCRALLSHTASCQQTRTFVQSLITSGTHETSIWHVTRDIRQPYQGTSLTARSSVSARPASMVATEVKSGSSLPVSISRG